MKIFSLSQNIMHAKTCHFYIYRIQMSSIQESRCIGSKQEDMPQNSIIKAIHDYEERYDSEEEIAAGSEQSQAGYQGFQNKRSLKIKPVRMFKDIISLKQENADKKKIVKQLQAQNYQLRNEYDSCVKHNDQLEHFFKEVQFTFQPQRKKIHASEVMVRAKKNLYQEAKEAKDRMKKMFRSTEASAIQELKIYIATLETQKQTLQKMLQGLSKDVGQQLKNQDFNFYQARKFEDGCRSIRKILDNQKKVVKARHEQYKVQKIGIKGLVKTRHLEGEKKRYREECQNMKTLLVQFQGLQYQIGLLKHRVKDRKKEMGQYEDILQKIKVKETSSLRLQKDLKEKFKTYEYMLQWSKQLKKQLEGRKSEHAKKKAQLQDEINNLTSQYQKYSQIYRTYLFEEQAAKRKGSRETNLPNQTSKPVYRKMVTFQEIRIQIRCLSFYLLQNKYGSEQFIDNLLKNAKKVNLEKIQKKVRIKTTISMEKYPPKNAVTVQDLSNNFEFLKCPVLTKEQFYKIAQFVVEDGNTDAKPSLNKKIAKQIFKNLLKRQIQSVEDLQAAEDGVKKLLRSRCDSIRPQLKLSGGFQQQIDMSVIKNSIRKYGFDPYSCNIYCQFFEFFGWQRSGTIGYVKLQDYDQLVNALIKKDKVKVPVSWEDDQGESW